MHSTTNSNNDKLQPPPSTSTQMQQQHHHHHKTHTSSPPKATKEAADNESNRSSKSSFKARKQKGCLCFRGGKVIKMNTCCGVLELSWIKVLAIVGMALNTFTFLVLLGLLIFGENSNARQNIELLTLRSDLYLYTAWVDTYTLVSAYSQNKTYLSYYYKYRDTIETLTNDLASKLPDYLISQFNSSDNHGYSTYLDSADSLAVNAIEKGNYSAAISILTSGLYYATKTQYQEMLDVVLKYILDNQKEAEIHSDVASVASLVIISVAVAVTVPSIIFIFAFAINREAMMAQRYRTARAVELMDTMNNEKLRSLFQKHCMKELNHENFEFLQKVTEYKRLVENQIELVQLLSDGGDSIHSNDLLSHSSSQISAVEENNNTTTVSVVVTSAASFTPPLSDSKKKKGTTSSVKSITELENELEEIEEKKFTLATEIYNNFLDMKGAKTVNTTKSLADKVKNELEYFNSKQIHSLSDDLFKTLEKEISIVLLDSHYRFKESMEFLKEMRVKKIKDINEKKKKNKGQSSEQHLHNDSGHHNR